MFPKRKRGYWPWEQWLVAEEGGNRLGEYLENVRVVKKGTSVRAKKDQLWRENAAGNSG